MTMNNQLFITISNLHWLNNDSVKDLCSHGKVAITFNNEEINELKNEEFTTSAMVLELMRTCFSDFDSKSKTNYLIPHCGHSMFSVKDDVNKVLILGCDNGFSWDIKHDKDEVIHVYKGQEVIMSNSAWMNQILLLVNQVEAFYKDVKKEPSNEDELGYRAFWNEWELLKRKIFNTLTSNIGKYQEKC